MKTETETEANYAIKSIFEIFNLRRSHKHATKTSVRYLSEDISPHLVIMIIIMMTVLRNGINRLSNQSA